MALLLCSYRSRGGGYSRDYEASDRGRGGGGYRDDRGQGERGDRPRFGSNFEQDDRRGGSFRDRPRGDYGELLTPGDIACSEQVTVFTACGKAAISVTMYRCTDASGQWYFAKLSAAFMLQFVI